MSLVKFGALVKKMSLELLNNDVKPGNSSKNEQPILCYDLHAKKREENCVNNNILLLQYDCRCCWDAPWHL